MKNWTRFCALKHASYVHSLHASYSLLFIDIFCALTLSNIVYHWFLCFSCFFFFSLSMTSCLFLLVLPLVGVLILELPHMSLLSSITYSLGFLVITFGLFLMYIPFLLRDVHSCMLSSLILLSVSLPFSFILLLRFIGVVQNHMVRFFQFSFIGFC